MDRLSGVRVLVAEDDFLIGAHLESVLRSEGAAVTLVSEVSELGGIDKSMVDVAILDLTLRDGAADAAANAMTASGIKVLIYSGAEAKTVGSRVSGAEVLSKPAEDETVISAVAAARKSG